MEQNEQGVSAYLDYFGAFSKNGDSENCMETSSCSTVESTESSDKEDDDDYDPSEDVDHEDGDSSSSDDWECASGKRKRKSESKRTRKKPQESFAGKSLSNGFSSVRNCSRKRGQVGSSKTVGGVNSPSEPSKTILRNILEAPPVPSLASLPSQKSKSTFFSPCLQALLMKNSDAVLVSKNSGSSSKALNISGQNHSSGNVLPKPFVSVDGTGNIVGGSASSLLVTMLKKAHSNASTPQSLVSKQDLNFQGVSNSKQTALDHIKKTSNINRPDTVLKEQVSCDICKTKTSAAVSLRLAVSDGEGCSKQFKLCEWCEMKMAESTAVKNHSASQLINTLVTGEKLLTAEAHNLTNGVDKHLRRYNSSEVAHLSDTVHGPSKHFDERRQRPQHKFKNSDNLSTDSKLLKTLQCGFEASENTDSQHSLSDTSSANIWETNQKKMVKDVSNPVIKMTNSNLESLLMSSNKVVKTEPLDDCEHNTCINSEHLCDKELPSESIKIKTEPPDDCELNTCINSQQLCDKELPSESVGVKTEPPDYVSEQDASVDFCEQTSNREFHPSGIPVIAPPADTGADNSSFKSEKMCNKEFIPSEQSYNNDECNAVVLSDQTSKEIYSDRIKIEPTDDDIHHSTLYSCKQMPNEEYITDKSILKEPFNEHSSVISSEQNRNQEFIYGRLKLESLDNSDDHSLSFNSSKQMSNNDFLSVEMQYNGGISSSSDNSEGMSNIEFLTSRCKEDPFYDTSKHNTSVKSSVQVNNKESELTEQDNLPCPVVVKEEPVDDYQTTSACDVHDSSSLQDLSSNSNTLNNTVNSRSDNFTSILSRLLNKEASVNTDSCKSKVHIQSSGSNCCFPSKDQHSYSNMHKTSDGKLSSCSLPCCEKLHTAHSSLKHSVPQNMLLSLLQRPIENEQTGSTDYSCASSGIQDFTRTEFAGLNAKTKSGNVSHSSNVVQALLHFTRSQLCSISPSDSDNSETGPSIFQTSNGISHTNLDTPGTDPDIPLRDSKNSTHRHSIISLKDSTKTDFSMPANHGRSDYWASDVLDQTSQSSNSSVPKSSSLLLQQLCKSHRTKTASGNEDSSLSQSPNDKTSTPCSNLLRNPSLVQALKAPATYSLSDLLHQLRQNSSKMDDASNSGSVISQMMDACTSGLERPSSADSLDIAQIPGPTSSHKILNGANSMDSAVNINLTENCVLSTERIIDGIQPRNAFQNKTVMLSEELKQILDNNSGHTRSLDHLETADVKAQKDSGKTEHNKSNKQLMNTYLDIGAKIIDKEDLNTLKPFVCMRCSQSFATSKSLKVHVQSHEQDKIYGCGICGRKYSTNSILKKHIHKYHLPVSDRFKKKRSK